MRKSRLYSKDSVLLKYLVGLFAILISQQANSELINVGYDDFNNPYLNVVNSADGSTPFTSLISDWLFLYEDSNGTGTLSIDANFNNLGAVEINNASVTTNTDGSLHVDGTIHFTDQSSSGSFLGDMIVTVDYDDDNQVTVFSFAPISFGGFPYDGFIMTDGPLASQLLDFHVTSSLLAIVENPFPIYSPVPIPSAVWLFGSGLLGLIAVARRKKA